MKESRIFQKHITSIELQTYEFILYYAEELCETIPEFPHHHPLHQIYYVLDGSINIFIEDKLVTVRENELLFLSKDIQHHVLYEPDQEKRYFAMIYDFVPIPQISLKGPDGEYECRDLQTVLSKIQERGFVLSHTPFHAEELLNIIQKEIQERQIGWNTSVSFYYEQFFIRALRHISTHVPKDREFSGKLNLAMEATKYIHKNYQKEISLETVAEYLNISPRHVNRAYQSLFGTTFMKNLNLLRIEYAKDYLSNSDHSIEEIAELVGIASSRILYKLFKEYEDISISEYRSKHSKHFKENCDVE